MYITGFEIANFRGISYVKAENLSPNVIIAGPNGSGKSCILEAFRLFKPVFGASQHNEWQQWFGENSINIISNNEDLIKIFNNKLKPLIISFDFKFHDDEKIYMKENIDALALQYVWRTEMPEAYAFGGMRIANFAEQFRQREGEMNAKSALLKAEVLDQISKDNCNGRVEISPNLRVKPSKSPLLSIIFSATTERLGIVDYHGPQRNYGRDPVQSLSVNLEQHKNNTRAHSLFGYGNKYAGIKSEMAAGYVRELLAVKAGISLDNQETLTNTLKALFETFFPHKEFLGPKPTIDGGISFPVVMSDGSNHDLDELSSGEKEIIYGYLRMRNSAPRHSVIMIDEPELHLNPKLIGRLPQFYAQHLGRALGNQIWLITHSDALIRDAIGNPDFDVFHMQPSSLINPTTGQISVGANQLKRMSGSDDLGAMVAELVGDYAAFLPNKAVVLLEGGGDSEFDKWMTATLFPEFSSKINLISGSNKGAVLGLHRLLDEAYEAGNLPMRFFCIVDRDHDQGRVGSVRSFNWPVYHIENFLIDCDVISRVVSNVMPAPISKLEVEEMLRGCAVECVDKCVSHLVGLDVGRMMRRVLDLSYNRTSNRVGNEIFSAASASRDRIEALFNDELTEEYVVGLEKKYRGEFEDALATDEWKDRIPGREILKKFSNLLPSGIGHTTLRRMIVNRMADEGKIPTRMAGVLKDIELQM